MKIATNTQHSRVALWVHCAIEYLLGLVLITQAMHAGTGTLVLAVAGASVALPAAVSGGAISVAHWIGPRTHRGLDVFVAAAIAVAPFVWSVPPLSLVILETTAALAIWLSFRTRYEIRRRKDTAPSMPPRKKDPAARRLGYYVGQLSRVAERLAQRS